MKAIVVTCPHCGARLQIAEARDTVTCEYCGTAARIQRRTRVLERVLPPRPVAAGVPERIAVQRRSPLAGVLLLAVIGVPLAIVAVAVSRGVRQAVVAVRKADAPTWQGTEGVLVTPGGLVGRSRRLGNHDEIHIVALDPTTGATRWETESIGTYTDTYQGTLAAAGDLVLFASPRAEIRAFAVADGKPRWTAKLAERVERFCDGGDTIVAIGTDRVARGIKRADGTLALAAPAEAAPTDPRKRKRPACATPLPTDQTEHGQSSPDDRDLGRGLGVNSDAIVSGPGGRVLSGTRATGTHVAMLIGLDDAGDGAGKERWRADVPTDPLGSVERAAQQVVVGEHEVCGAYYGSSVAHRMRFACFAMTDGHRLWDGEVHDSPLSAVAITGGLVLISTWGQLEARDPETGTVRWRYYGEYDR